MTDGDIVDRLWVRVGDCTWDELEQDRCDAAAEIERLRAELAEANADTERLYDAITNHYDGVFTPGGWAELMAASPAPVRDVRDGVSPALMAMVLAWIIDELSGGSASILRRILTINDGSIDGDHVQAAS